MTTVFLSHSSKDDSLAVAIVKWMKERGFVDVFVDHDKIRVGDRWADALRSAKSACRIIICVVTPSWLSSDECFAEFLAGWYAGKRIIPLLAVDASTLDLRQQERLRRLLAEDLGFDLGQIGPPPYRLLDASPGPLARLEAGLRAGGALTKVGLDPYSFEIDAAKRTDPFPGLESFSDDDADAAIFFGRSIEIAASLEELREMRATGDRRAYLIVGASGSGKSSLMKAGILPRLRRERAWLVLRSFRPGSDPLYSFADAIARSAADVQITWAPGSVREELLSAWRAAQRNHAPRSVIGQPVEPHVLEPEQKSLDAALLEALEARIRPLRERSMNPGSTCLIAVDQAEELVRAGDESARALGDFLTAVSRAPLIDGAASSYAQILTVRDDRFAELRSSNIFRATLFRTADIRTLPLFRFAHAIEQPAERYGVSVEPALVQALIEDAPEKDALPLLAFALRRLWTRFAAEKRIVRSNYDQIGKLSGIVEDAAERALRGMDPRDDSPLTPAKVGAERNERVSRLFVPALAQLDERGRVSRRLAPLTSFTEGDLEYLNPFTKWRLLVARAGMMEIAHEAMFREWPRFSEWMQPEKGRLEALQGAEAAAATWDHHDRRPEYLAHRGIRLSNAEALRKAPDYAVQIDTSSTISAYLLTCRAQERRRRTTSFGLIALLSVTAVALLVTNARTVTNVIDSVSNIEAALPGVNFITSGLQSELDIRRNLMRAVLNRYVKQAVEGTKHEAGASSGTGKSDPWSVGQITAAIGKGVIEPALLEEYYSKTLVPECTCWAPVDGGQHAGATAWILLGHASQGIRIPPAVLHGVLTRQYDNGGWPLFFNATRGKEANSTYATALLALALFDLAEADAIAPEQRKLVQDAIGRAQRWLIERAPSANQLWLDYPDASGRRVSSRGNSAFIVYALLATGVGEAARTHFKNWYDQLDVPKGLDDMDTSDQFVQLETGEVRRDGTRYIALPWELAAIGKGGKLLGAYDRIRARRYFREAMQNWPRDQTGRFDFLTAESLFAVNTLVGLRPAR